MLSLLLLFMSIICMTISCNFNPEKTVTEPLRIFKRCYEPPRAVIEQTTVNDPFIEDEVLYYLTEICTNTHRLVLYVSKELKLEQSVFKIMLDHTFNGVNLDIKKFKKIYLTTKQQLRLKRYLLEKIFYHEYKIIRPKAVFLRLKLPDLMDTNGLARKIDNLPRIYDETTMTYYVTRSDYGEDVVIVRLVPY